MAESQGITTKTRMGGTALEQKIARMIYLEMWDGNWDTQWDGPSGHRVQVEHLRIARKVIAGVKSD